MFKNIAFDPPFPAEYIVLLGCVVGLLTIANYFRARSEADTFKRTLLTLMRLSVVAGMTILLLRPMKLATEDSASGKNVFTVLVDGSRSMGTADVDGGTRFESVRKALIASEDLFMAELRRNYDVRFSLFADTSGRMPFDQVLASQPRESIATDIATTLSNAGITSEGQHNAGILLISDGRDNNGNDPANAAVSLRAAGIPVWTTTVGTTDETKDLAVAARFDQSFLFRNQASSLKVDLHQRGFDGWYGKVELFRDGVSMGVQQCMLEKGMQPLSFPIKEAVKGTYRYTVRVEGLEGESDLKNNERTVFVQVADDRAKVLLAEASPYWDSKFLLRALQADPNLEVAAIFDMSERRDKMIYVTQAAPEGVEGTAEGTSALRVPQTREELFQYDCVILGKGVEEIFDPVQVALLKEYVEVRGGNIIFARGKPYEAATSALADIEPVIWDDGALAKARFALTSAGTKNPMFNFGVGQSADVIIRELPEMISVTKVKEEKSLAVILAKGVGAAANEEIAAISYQRYGKGKVMTVGASGLWQWAFMKDELSKYDEVYARFWGQMIRWLVYDSEFLPGQNIAFKTDQFSYNAGDAAALIVQTKDAAADFTPQIRITAPSGTTATLEPAGNGTGDGFFSTLYTPEEEGTYQAVLLDNGHGQGEQTIEFSVYANDQEARFVGANPELMAQIAAASGGEVLAVEDWKALPEKLKQHELSLKEETKPEDAWDQGRFFVLLVCVLGVEWFIRRRTGLL
jgi:hypothetical protein